MLEVDMSGKKNNTILFVAASCSEVTVTLFLAEISGTAA